MWFLIESELILCNYSPAISAYRDSNILTRSYIHELKSGKNSQHHTAHVWGFSRFSTSSTLPVIMVAAKPWLQDARDPGDPGDPRGEVMPLADQGKPPGESSWGKIQKRFELRPEFHSFFLNGATGWWFGCHQFYFCINIGNVIIPTDFHIFQRGGPTTNQIRPQFGVFGAKFLTLFHRFPV